MSGSAISERIRTKLRIPATRRKPCREEVAALRVEVLRMPQSLSARLDDGSETTAGGVLKELNEAKDAVWSRAVTDAERIVAVNTAKGILATAKPKVVKLRAVAGAAPAPATLQAPVATKATTANGLALVAKLDALRTDITTKQAVIGAVWQPRGSGVNAQLADEAGLRQRVSETIVDATKLAAFEAELAALRTRLDEALTLSAAWTARKPAAVAKADGFAQALAPLAARLKDTPDARKVSPELDKLDDLRFQLGNPSANVARIDSLITEMAGVVRDLAGKDIAAHATAQLADAAAKGKAAEDRKVFNAAVAEKLRKLGELTQALGGDATVLEDEYRRTLESFGTAGHTLDPAALGADLARRVDAATQTEGRKLATLRADLRTLSGTLKTETQALRTTLGAVPVLAVDWKQIDGMTAAFEQQMAGTAAVDIGTLAALRSAKALGDKILARLATLKDPAVNAPMLGFQVRSDKAVADLKGAVAGEASPLGLYFPAERTKLDAELKQFRKDMATMKADAALKSFDALDTLLRTKIAEAAEVATAVAAATTVLDKKKKAYGKLRGSRVSRNFEEPNKASMAMDALKATLDATPASKDAIALAQAELERALTDSTTAAELRRGVADAKRDKVAETQRQTEVKDALKTRRREADSAYSDAKAAVRQVNGDTLALDAIGVLLDEADKQIKAGDEDAARRTLDRMLQRTDMLLVNPEGEVNRQRKALPKLFGEWQAVLNTTAGLLEQTRNTVAAYVPDPANPEPGKTAASVLRLCAQMDAYTARFTRQPLAALKPLLAELSSDDLPEPGRRKAREAALAILAAQADALQKHPLTRELTGCPLPGASAIPGRLLTALSRLQYTVLTSVR